MIYETELQPPTRFERLYPKESEWLMRFFQAGGIVKIKCDEKGRVYDK